MATVTPSYRATLAAGSLIIHNDTSVALRDKQGLQHRDDRRLESGVRSLHALPPKCR
jgi:hypothetical protein